MSGDLAAAVERFGSKAAAARALGIPVTTLKDRLNRPSLDVKGRKQFEIENGVILIFSDAHFWPGEPSVAYRALVKFCKDLKPKALVCNGDALDGSAISRHPPINWESCPSVKEELTVCQERLGNLEKLVDGKIPLFWPLGNHDSRFSTRLAQVAPEFKNVHGTRLQDHFPAWEPCWSLFINGDVCVKHRLKGGVHAPYNNALHSGMSMITGHLHSQKVTPFSDYRGTRYGVDTGCLADPYHAAFQNYTEDSPKDWRSGFCVLTFVNGSLLMPELVSVWDESSVQFRGQLINC